MLKTDFIIVGQGIAGTMMAWHLMKAGKSFVVVDQGIPSSSTVAAGLFNPVTGRRFVKSWLIDELLPVADDVYTGLENLLGKKLLYKIPIVRYVTTGEEKMVYEKALQNDKEKYIAGFTFSEQGDTITACEIQGGGYVDTSLMIRAFRDYLIEKDSFIEAVFNYDDLLVQEEGMSWQGISAYRIIFCEGYKGEENPFFPGLPFNLAKGEILTVRIPDLNSEKILMSGGYLLPIGNDIYKSGGTYEWDDLNPEPTESGLSALKAILARITDMPYEILDHEAGIRPAVMHRRPFLGSSPRSGRIFILNGMGTKGVILAPYFARQLTDHILMNTPLLKEVDVSILIKAYLSK